MAAAGPSGKSMMVHKTPFSDRKNFGMSATNNTPLSQKKNANSLFNSFLTPKAAGPLKQKTVPFHSMTDPKTPKIKPAAPAGRWYDDPSDITFRPYDPCKHWAEKHIPTDEELNRIMFPSKESDDEPTKIELPILDALPPPPPLAVDAMMADFHLAQLLDMDIPSIDHHFDDDGLPAEIYESFPLNGDGFYF